MTEPPHDRWLARILLKLKATGGAAVMAVCCLSIAAASIWGKSDTAVLMLFILGVSIVANLDRFSK
jgi:hypothetical protein